MPHPRSPAARASSRVGAHPLIGLGEEGAVCRKGSIMTSDIAQDVRVEPAPTAPPMTSKLARDPRIDPRIKALFGAMPTAANPGDAKSREELLAEENSEAARQRWAGMQGMFDAMDNEQVAPSAGLSIRTERFASQPDGNEIKVNFIRPEAVERPACILYLHGGGMTLISALAGIS